MTENHQHTGGLNPEKIDLSTMVTGIMSLGNLPIVVVRHNHNLSAMTGSLDLSTQVQGVLKLENLPAEAQAGVAGPAGPAGPAGADGADGDSIFLGGVAPTADIGEDGDIYIDLVLGDVYEKAEGAWTIKGNIKGPKGDKGDAGEAGAVGQQGPQGEVGPAGPAPDMTNYYTKSDIDTQLGALNSSDLANDTTGTGVNLKEVIDNLVSRVVALETTP